MPASARVAPPPFRMFATPPEHGATGYTGVMRLFTHAATRHLDAARTIAGLLARRHEQPREP